MKSKFNQYLSISSILAFLFVGDCYWLSHHDKYDCKVFINLAIKNETADSVLVKILYYQEEPYKIPDSLNYSDTIVSVMPGETVSYHEVLFAWDGVDACLTDRCIWNESKTDLNSDGYVHQFDMDVLIFRRDSLFLRYPYRLSDTEFLEKTNNDYDHISECTIVMCNEADGCTRSIADTIETGK